MQKHLVIWSVSYTAQLNRVMIPGSMHLQTQTTDSSSITEPLPGTFMGSGDVDLTLLLSVVAILISFGTLFLQFIWWGRLTVAGVTSIGMWINYTGGRSTTSQNSPADLLRDLNQTRPDGEPNHIQFVLPLLFSNTGNWNKQILNVRLVADFGAGPLYFRANRFVSTLGIGEDGSHEVPTPTNWIHQIVIPARSSEIRFIEFVSSVEPQKVRLDANSSLSFEVQLKTKGGGRPKCYERFSVRIKEIADNYGGSRYTTYFTEKGISD